MMTRQQAIAYGKRTGVKYYIYGDGALYGGTRTKEQAERQGRAIYASGYREKPAQSKKK